MGDETKPTPARELRDALAEAPGPREALESLTEAWGQLYAVSVCDNVPAEVIALVGTALDATLSAAQALLASLPSVKLKMGWEE